MRILKLLNKRNLSIFIIYILVFSTNLFAEEDPVDIWDLEKKNEENSSNVILEDGESNQINIDLKKKKYK